jgi:hypothetical protein
MAPEEMAPKSTVKVGKVDKKPEMRENDFFATTKIATIETTRKNNWNALCLLDDTAQKFPFDSVIKTELAALRERARKDPEILKNMKTMVSGEQIA